MELDETLKDIERFYEAARNEKGFECSPELLPAAGDEAIAGLATKYSLEIPNDVRTFWKRGLKHAAVSVEFQGDDRFASAHFDWLEIENVDRGLAMFRDIAKNAEGEARRLLEQGIPLSHSPPQIVVNPDGAVFHFSTRNALRSPVSSSLSQFMEHWLESGCFSSHALNEYLPRIKHLVPTRIPERENLWIAYYRSAFANYV